jgi:hypothetical protein
MSNLEELGLPTEATDTVNKSKKPNFLWRHKKAVAGVGLSAVVLAGGLKVYNSAQYAPDDCSDALLQIQVDETKLFSLATLARTLHGDFYWDRPHNYNQLASEIYQNTGYAISAQAIMDLPQNQQKAANPDATYPTSVDDNFEAPGVYCVALPGPRSLKINSNLVEGTPSDINGQKQYFVYDGQQIRDYVTSLPGIENENEAVARVATAEEKLGLS